ncbi:hypothetical protein AU467_25885 [Mesorhizobium loti]|uniref:DUF2938 domain-containing protein n=1 Tax=Rhizobium loti TaxID=381 RepID=A0A101KRA3_RHILI|nr:hypothetical protein AU467_25885 [Mesorhizobium loti]
MVSESIVAGVVATLATDLWARLLHAVAGRAPANWGLVGRWVACMPRGVFVHRPINTTPAVHREVAIGWIFHYAVGIIYAALYLVIMRLGFGSGPTLISAVAFALILLVAPWFVMQPALGLGFMASRAPKPAVARAVSISVHAWFGFGLYFGAWLAGA